MMQYSGTSCSGAASLITVGSNLGNGACTKATVGNVYFQATWALFSSTTAIMNAASSAGAGLVVGTWSDSQCIYQSSGEKRVVNDGLSLFLHTTSIIIIIIIIVIIIIIIIIIIRCDQ